MHDLTIPLHSKYNSLCWQLSSPRSPIRARPQTRECKRGAGGKQEIAGRILQSIFPDDDEEQHDVRRKRLFHNFLARQDKVPISRSPANTIHLQSPSRERDDVPPTTVIDTPTISHDDGSATLVPPRPFSKHRQDKSMLIDWIGSWWAGKPRRPSPISSIDSNTSSVTTAPPSEPTSSGLAVVKQPNQAKRRRTTKSAFGTLGIPILNPIISTTPTPTTSVTVPKSTAPAIEISSTAEEIPASTDTVHSKMSRKTSATVASATSTTNDADDSSIVVLPSPLLRTMFSAPLALAEPRLTATSAEKIWLDRPLPYVLQTEWHLLHRTFLCRLPRFMNSRLFKRTISQKHTRLFLTGHHSRHKSDVVGPQVVELAHMLMKQARDGGLVLLSPERQRETQRCCCPYFHETRSHVSQSEHGRSCDDVAGCGKFDGQGQGQGKRASRGGRGNLMQHVSSPLFGALRSSNNAGEKTITPRRGPNSGSHAMTQGSDSPQGSSTIPGSGAATTTRATTANASTPTNDDRLEENDEGDEEGSFTGGGGDTLSFKSRRSTGIDIVQDNYSCDGSLSLDLGNLQKTSDLHHQGRVDGKAPLQAVQAATATVRLSLADRLGRHYQQHCRFPRQWFLLRLLQCCPSLPTCTDTRTRYSAEATQLTEIHDEKRGANQKVWDAFLKHRSNRAKTGRAEQPRHVSSFTGGSAIMASGGASLAAGGVAAIFGMKITGGTRGGDEDEVQEELTHSEGLIGFAQLCLPANKGARVRPVGSEWNTSYSVQSVVGVFRWIGDEGAWAVPYPNTITSKKHIQRHRPPLLLNLSNHISRSIIAIWAFTTLRHS
ncbi:hypothetical protein M378DRAFT_13470 [Amanita muscaria Koide BX008]|uniref:Uncharacterized protein n=1 Tax=Amanita muscaria (strain Koide BX008) TaxID=946122 RepID=A0A0C2WJ64_AMAMK|nr:hypothetical protein M378DRAFT_13470 [Amanita muscaria Koide BX008]